MKTVIRIILGVSVLINVLLILALWRGPKIISFGTDEKIYKDSINVLKKERVGYVRKVDSLNRSNDSLIMLKNDVKIKYYAKAHFVYTADPNQLDSIIRAAIK